MLQQAQKPIAIFHTDAVPYKDETGVTNYKNVHFVTIQQAGSKDSVEKIAEEWIADLARKATTRGDFDSQADEYREWYDYFSKRFEAYKSNLEMPMDGTPIKMCLSFTPAERAQCEAIHVYTLEGLAECNEEVIQRLGMGARTLKTKAAKMLETQAGGKVAEQNAALQQKVSELSTQVMELKAMLLAEGKSPDAAPNTEIADMKAMMATFMANNSPKKPGRPAKTQ